MAFNHTRMQWGYFTISVLCYIYLLSALFIASRRATTLRSAKVGRMIASFTIWTVIVWTIIPLLWVLGEGLQKINVNVEIIMYSLVRLR